jgi:hypothetical protein
MSSATAFQFSRVVTLRVYGVQTARPRSKFCRLQKHVLKFFAVVTAFLMLPGLALAGTDHGKGNDGQNNGNQFGRNKGGDPNVSSVPEANPAIVLIPFVGAVLLVSSLQLLRRRSC